MLSFLALIISIVALVFSYLAYTKSGGNAEELKAKVEDLGISTEGLRQKTADTLNKVEKMVRGDKAEREGASSQEAPPAGEDSAEPK